MRIAPDRNPAQRAAIARTIKTWVKEADLAPEDATLLVTELSCSEPGCPPVETVIAVLSCGARTQWKLHRRMTDVTREDIFRLSATHEGKARP